MLVRKRNRKRDRAPGTAAAAAATVSVLFVFGVGLPAGVSNALELAAATHSNHSQTLAQTQALGQTGAQGQAQGQTDTTTTLTTTTETGTESGVPEGEVMPSHEPVPSDVGGSGGVLTQVTKQLMCQCGCALTVAACEGTMQCSIGTRMREQAQTRLDAGDSVDEALAYFEGEYGKKVLAAPKKQGFDLFAWVVPPVALVVSAVVLWIVIRAWVRNNSLRSSGPGPNSTTAGDELNTEYLAAVDTELEGFDI